MDGGAWWATVYGVAKSRTRLSDFTFTLDGSTEGETQLKDESVNLKTDEWKVHNPTSGRKQANRKTMTTMTKP